MVLPKRNFVWVLASAALGLSLGSAFRYLVFEVHDIGQLCDPGTGPLWCVPRQAIIQFFWPHDPLDVGALGVLALLLGIGSLIHGGRFLLHGSAIVCGFGVILKNADLASIGLALTLIAAARR